MSTSPSQLDSTRELLIADPNAAVHARVVFAVGCTGALALLAFMAAFGGGVARIGVALGAGVTIAAWTSLLIEVTGRRGRVRRAYDAWLHSLAARESLFELIELHRALLRGGSDPERAHAHLESLLNATERSGITPSIERWTVIAHSLREFSEGRLESLRAERARLMRIRAEDEAATIMARRSKQVLLSVRRAAPRISERTLRGLLYDGEGIHPDVPGARDAMALDLEHTGLAVIPRPTTAPLRDTTRWAPFAATGPLTKELLELFGDESALPPWVDGLPDPDDGATLADLHREFSTGYSSAARGIAIDSSSVGELLAGRRKPMFSRLVEEVDQPGPPTRSEQTTQRGK